MFVFHPSLVIDNVIGVPSVVTDIGNITFRPNTHITQNFHHLLLFPSFCVLKQSKAFIDRGFVESKNKVFLIQSVYYNIIIITNRYKFLIIKVIKINNQVIYCAIYRNICIPHPLPFSIF